jgi:hypothetical protein
MGLTVFIWVRDALATHQHTRRRESWPLRNAANGVFAGLEFEKIERLLRQMTQFASRDTRESALGRVRLPRTERSATFGVRSLGAQQRREKE